MTSFFTAQHVFIVGIKGVAMSGLARILHQKGMHISGSDSPDAQITDGLLAHEQMVISALDAPLPEHTEYVIYAGSHGGVAGIQVIEALAKGIPIISQAEVIAQVAAQFAESVAVCGCHGKTGTTALTAFLLMRLGVRVSYLVGAPYFVGHNAEGELIQYPGAHFDPEASVFVFEADEYAVAPPQDKTPKILHYFPTDIICTNIDFDHPDIYADLAAVTHTFQTFFTHAKRVYSSNSKTVEENAKGVIAYLLQNGYAREQIESLRSDFVGVARRLEVKLERNGITVIDDYAHHPQEIVASIAALRMKYHKRRLLILFQSHTYSRTLALKDAFITALAQADKVYIDTIFPSAREAVPQTPLTAVDLAQAAHKQGFMHVYGFTSRKQLVDAVRKEARAGDVIVTMGAGDIYSVIHDLI